MCVCVCVCVTLAGLCEGSRVDPLPPLQSSSPPLGIDVLSDLDERPLVEGQILCSLTGEVKQSHSPLLCLNKHKTDLARQKLRTINRPICTFYTRKM